MNFILDESQAAIRDSVRRYCNDRYVRRPAEAGADADANRRSGASAHWAEWSRLGWLGVSLPESVGGMGGSSLEMALIQEEFGRALVHEPYVSCVILAAQTIIGTQSEIGLRLLERMRRGEQLLALAHLEPRARSGSSWVETGARLRGGGNGFILSGRKCAVVDGDIADRFVVSARTQGPAGDRDGISLFVVNRDARGLSRRDYRTIDGYHAADLLFDDVEVSRDALLGDEGSACAAIEMGLRHAIVGVCAEAVGAMEAVIAMTADYLKTRRAYGVTLSTHQVLQHRIADMAVELELSRSMLHVALAALEHPEEHDGASGISAAKAFIGASGLCVAASAIQLHGGIGVAEASSVGQYFKRLTAIAAQFGNSDYHLGAYAREALGMNKAPRSPLRAVPTLALPKAS
jgi:alkylation response protein AidB-like acyl-CoA dehydrogenase